MADHLTDRDRRMLSGEKLLEAYRSILTVLDEFGVEATFAFVGAFSQSPDDFSRIRPAIEDLGRIAPDYVGPALRGVDEDGGDGWNGYHLVELVGGTRAAHEIALHGVTHVPWIQMDEAAANAEMAIFHELEGPVRQSATFVYPRNFVAHERVLAAHGFAGFRTAHSRSRLTSFLSEFNLLETPDHPQVGDGLIRIPSGFFLNWRNGPRRLVPPAVTRLRAKRLLDAAERQEAIIHYWLHPENIATAPATLGLLRTLVRDVAAARDAGRCEVMTQLAYCRWIESPQ